MGLNLPVNQNDENNQFASVTTIQAAQRDKNFSCVPAGSPSIRRNPQAISHTSLRTSIISSVKACKNQVMTHLRTKSRNCSEIATKEITTETPEWGTPFFFFLSNGLLFSFQLFKGLGDQARTWKKNGAAWKIRRRGKLSSVVSKKMSKRR